MGNELENKNNCEKDVVEKVINFLHNSSCEEKCSIILVIGLIISSLITYFTRNYYLMPTIIDNEQITAIVKQYKNLHKNSTSEYNRILTNYQNNGVLVSPDSFYSTHKTTLEDCETNIDYCSSSRLIKSLNKNLAEYNNKLVNNIKKINNATSNNIKINYNSLKITDNINNNLVKNIIKQQVEDCKNSAKIINNIAKFTLVLIFVTGLLGAILL